MIRKEELLLIDMCSDFIPLFKPYSCSIETNFNEHTSNCKSYTYICVFMNVCDIPMASLQVHLNKRCAYINKCDYQNIIIVCKDITQKLFVQDHYEQVFYASVCLNETFEIYYCNEILKHLKGKPLSNLE